VSPIENPYREAIRVTLIVTAASALLHVLGHLRAAGSSSHYFLVGGGSLLIICAMALLLLVVTGRRMGRQIQALLDGGSLAHWTYSAMEWGSFTESEWRRASRKARGRPVRVLGIMLVVGVVLSLMSSLTFLEGILLGGAIGVPLGIVVGAIAWLRAWTTHRKRRSAAVGEVYFGPAGIYQDGFYTALRGFGWWFKGAAVEPGDPPVLRFDFESRRGPHWQKRVAVPKGKEDEARKVVAQFEGAAPGAPAGQLKAAQDDKQLQEWVDGVMAPLQPDQLKFGPGEKVVDVFQRTFQEEEHRVRSHEHYPARLMEKLIILDELRRKFA
jgi:hypothetical protein